MKTKIRPCPFCGSKKTDLVYPLELPDDMCVACMECLACGPIVNLSFAGDGYPIGKNETPEEAMEKEAIRLWNLAVRGNISSRKRKR